jgi:hypothetical protein
MIARWREAFRDRRFIVQFVGVTAALVAVLSGFARFLAFNEAREGARLSDPLLSLLAAHDLTWIAFGLIYLSLFAAIFSLIGNPRALLLGMATYAIMATCRIIMMFMTPLAPPDGLIPLVDPVIEYFGTGATVNKDLFFSGHTSTLFVLFLTATVPWLRALFLTCAIAVATCVLIQHVHYTIDVLVAPFVTYGAYRIARVVAGAGRGGREMGEG